MTCKPTPIVDAAGLAQLQKDYAAIVSGNKARVIVDQNGERVEFTSANLPRLYAFIQEQQALLTPGCARPRPNRPMSFVF